MVRYYLTAQGVHTACFWLLYPGPWSVLPKHLLDKQGRLEISKKNLVQALQYYDVIDTICSDVIYLAEEGSCYDCLGPQETDIGEPETAEEWAARILPRLQRAIQKLVTKAPVAQ